MLLRMCLSFKHSCLSFKHSCKHLLQVLIQLWCLTSRRSWVQICTLGPFWKFSWCLLLVSRIIKKKWCKLCSFPASALVWNLDLERWMVAAYCSSVIGQISSSVWPIKYLYQLQICNWCFHLLLCCSWHQSLRSSHSLFLKLSCWSCLQLMSCKNLLLLSSSCVTV